MLYIPIFTFIGVYLDFECWQTNPFRHDILAHTPTIYWLLFCCVCQTLNIYYGTESTNSLVSHLHTSTHAHTRLLHISRKITNQTVKSRVDWLRCKYNFRGNDDDAADESDTMLLKVSAYSTRHKHTHTSNSKTLKISCIYEEIDQPEIELPSMYGCRKIK